MSDGQTHHPNVQYTTAISQAAQENSASSIGYSIITGVTTDPIASANWMTDQVHTYKDLNNGYGLYIVDGYFRPLTDFIFKITQNVEWIHFIISYIDIIMIYVFSLALIVVLEVLSNITNNSIIHQVGKYS